MKMINVLNMVAEGKIKKGTKFILGDNLFIFNGDRFKAGNFYLGGRIFLNARDLNIEVDLILPKPKKYLVKFNMRGLKENEMYLNYQTENDYVQIADKKQNLSYKTHFTKSELQSIKLVREFLEDMEGKYELIEVEDNEID